MADSLEDLLDLLDEARMEDRLGKLDVAKVASALGHVLLAGRTLELAVDRAKPGIVQTLNARLGARLVHGLGVDDMSNTHILDLLGREETELNLLHRFEGRVRVREVKIRHLELLRCNCQRGGWSNRAQRAGESGEGGEKVEKLGRWVLKK